MATEIEKMIVAARKQSGHPVGQAVINTSVSRCDDLSSARGILMGLLIAIAVWSIVIGIWLV